MATIEIIQDSIQLIRMSDEEYFSAKYKDYISNSKLGLLNPAQDGSIEKFQQGFQESYNESFELGSAVHCMLLQPDDFYISDLDKPSSKLGVFVLEVYKARQEGLTIQQAMDRAKISADYYQKSLSPARIKTAIKGGLDFYLKKLKDDKIVRHTGEEPIYLSARLKEKYIQCMESAKKDVKLMGKLDPAYLLEPNEVYNEYAIFCDIKVTMDDGSVEIISIKGKLDNFTVDHETETVTLNDLKTTGKRAAYFMGNRIFKDGEEIWIDGSFQKYHYYRQMGLYLWLLNAAINLAKGRNYKLKANMLLVETIPEFSTRVCELNGTHIEMGLKQFEELIVYMIKNGQHKRSN